MTIFCYQHHINDWRTKTGELSLEEKGAYREMMDWFYALEGKLPSDIEKLSRILGLQTQSERTAIASVSHKFWTANADGYLTQKRACEELEKIKAKSFKASKSAKIRYNKDLASANAERTQSERTANQEPITNNHKVSKPPLPPTDEKPQPESVKVKTEKKEPDGFLDFWEIFPKQRAGSKEKAKQAYENALKRAGKEKIHEGTRKYSISDEVARGFAKGAAAWLNDDRWAAEYRPPNSNKTNPANGRPTYSDSIRDAGKAALDNILRQEEIRQTVGGG